MKTGDPVIGETIGGGDGLSFEIQLGMAVTPYEQEGYG
jgi:hypothetical protein